MKVLSGFSGERPVSDVPPAVMIILVAAFTAQILWHAWRPGPVAARAELPAPPPLAILEVAGLGEPTTLSGILMLWLQSFDNQPGLSLSFRELDYDRIIEWLDRILELEPRSHYPLLSAARVYSAVPDEEKKRKMLEFVHAKFLERPAERWQWMTHAVYVAKHRIEDPALALEYARAIRKNVPPGAAPDWAVQMEVFVLEDMGDIEGAKVLLGGLLESGAIKDKNQYEFLMNRLTSDDKEEAQTNE